MDLTQLAQLRIAQRQAPLGKLAPETLQLDVIAFAVLAGACNALAIVLGAHRPHAKAGHLVNAASTLSGWRLMVRLSL